MITICENYDIGKSLYEQAQIFFVKHKINGLNFAFKKI